MGVARKIITNVVSLSGSNFIARFLSFFSVLLIVRGLSLYEYGVLTLAMAVTGPVALVAGLGMDSVFTSDTARYIGEKNYARARKLISEFVKNKIVITLLVLICGFFFREMLVERYGDVVSIYFFWLAVWVLVQTLRTTVDALAQIYERFVVLSIANVLETAVKLMVVLIFWQTIGLTIISVLWVYIISKFVSFLFAGVPICISERALAKLAPEPEKESVMWSIIKHHGKWEMIRNILSGITGNLKPWFVKFTLNTESVALFSLAQTVYSVVSQSLPIRNVIMPMVIKRISDKPLSSLIVQKANKYSIFFYIIAIIAFLTVGGWLLVYFFPNYALAVPLIDLMLLNLLTTTITSHQGIFLYGLRAQKILLFSDLLGIFSRIVLLPLWLWVFGLNGAALEMIALALITVFIYEFFLRKKHGITTWKWKALFVFDAYDKWLIDKIWERIKKIFTVGQPK